MKLKYRLPLLIGGGIIATVIYLNFKSGMNQRKVLHNNVLIFGTILKIKKSDNHNFGIYYFKVDSTNNTQYDKRNKLIPYKIVGGYGEVYRIVDMGDKPGFKIVINSNEEKVTTYYEGKKNAEWVLDPLDDNADFILKNSELSSSDSNVIY